MKKKVDNNNNNNNNKPPRKKTARCFSVTVNCRTFYARTSNDNEKEKNSVKFVRHEFFRQPIKKIGNEVTLQ